MGKDLKGKELGVGLRQREDGLYCARSRANGKNTMKYFKKLSDAKKWISSIQYELECGNSFANDRMPVENWYDYWIERIKTNRIAKKTLDDYKSLYEIHISPVLGRMKLGEVKALHCMEVLNIMQGKNMADSSIKKVRTVMHDMFESAVENKLISNNPVTRSVSVKGEEAKEKYIMTAKEEKMFLESIAGHCHYTEFAFILETGLRYGEISGLKWKDIDFDNKLLKVSRSIGWDKNKKLFVEKPPKSKAGYRNIPLSEKAIGILLLRKEMNKTIPVIAGYSEYIFRNTNGSPSHKTTFNKSLKAICKNIKLPQFSIHCLRHVFATRCIEAGIRPKTLQKILGHSKISTTMDLYVHVTEDDLITEFAKLKTMRKVV